MRRAQRDASRRPERASAPAAVRTGVLIALVALVLGAPPPAAAGTATVLRDAAWPSVGPGSDGSLARPEEIELEVEGTAVVPLPPSSLAVPGPRRGTMPAPRTPPVTLGFPGVDGSDKDGALRKPPDTHVAIGGGAGTGGRVVMVTNSGLQIWDKTGAALAGPLPLDFFLGTPVPSGFDPKVLYDQHADRFFIVVLEGKTPALSTLHLAVSTSATPGNLTTDWILMAGSAVTAVDGAATWFDYPSLGADADALVVTGNLFDASGFHRGAKIRVFDKASLLAGVYAFTDLDVSEADVPGSFTLQPAHVFGTTDSGGFYLVNRIGPTAYRLWEIAGAPAAPVIVGNAPHFWASGFQVGLAPQAGTPVQLDTVSGRAMNAVYRDGHVWTTLTGDTDLDGWGEVYWAKIATNGGMPAPATVADAGYIDGSDGDEVTFMPSIAVNAAGDAAICYTQSFVDQFPDMRYVTRAAADPPAFFQAPVVAATSVGFYDAFFPLVRDRWGDYSATVVDPDDDLTFWAANEIVALSGIDVSIWGTFIARLGAVAADPNPPTPTPTPPPPLAGPVEAGGLIFTGEVHAEGFAGGDAFNLAVPRLVAVSPDGAHVYTWSDAANVVVIFFRDAATGALQYFGAQLPLVNGDPLRTRGRMLLSPDARHLYITDDSSHGIFVLARHPILGILSGVEFDQDPPLDAPFDQVLSPGGEHLYVVDTGADGGAVVAYARAASDGSLSPVQSFDLLALDRDAAKANALAISPDGAHVYVTSESRDSAVVFARDGVTGVLTPLAILVHGDPGIAGLLAPSALEVSSDGAHVYVASTRRGTLEVWARDGLTGLLTFVADDSAGAPLKRPQRILMSADGRYLYVADSDRPGVLVFLRDAASGRLAFLGEHREGQLGVAGLRNTLDLALSPDGGNLYSVSVRGVEGDAFGSLDLSSGALVNFVRDACGSGTLSGAEQCDDGNTGGGDGCSASCALELCDPVPRGDCRQSTAPGKGLLKLKAGKGSLAWKLLKGEATALADLGDPLATASYALCVYDASGAPQPLRLFAMPAAGDCLGRPCWDAKGTRGFAYKDKAFTPDGVLKLDLGAGDAGKAKMSAKGKGSLLRLPALPLAPPVTAQLVSGETGACWSATYSAPSRNDAEQFKAKAD